MATFNQQHTQTVSEEQVLAKALTRIMDFYGLSGRELSQILGISEATISRMVQHNRCIDPKSTEGQLALLLIRLFRSLNAMVGNDTAKVTLWLKSPHRYFTYPPIEHIKTVTGLVEVVNYLDAIRGQAS